MKQNFRFILTYDVGTQTWFLSESMMRAKMWVTIDLVEFSSLEKALDAIRIISETK